MAAPRFSAITDYIRALPEGIRPAAEAIRETIKQSLPDAVEAVKYGIPAFLIGGKLIGGKPLIYFAIWKKHVGFYPIYPGSEAFEAEIAPYRTGKDTVRFPLGRSIPHDLIRKIVQSQVALRENTRQDPGTTLSSSSS